MSAIVFVAAFHAVSGFSTGGPHAACATLTPQHFESPPQIPPSPHIVAKLIGF